MEDFVLHSMRFMLNSFKPALARSCVEVARLPKDVLVEVEARAYIPKIICTIEFCPLLVTGPVYGTESGIWPICLPVSCHPRTPIQWRVLSRGRDQCQLSDSPASAMKNLHGVMAQLADGVMAFTPALRRLRRGIIRG